jgi:hypothetical protein
MRRTVLFPEMQEIFQKTESATNRLTRPGPLGPHSARRIWRRERRGRFRNMPDRKLTLEWTWRQRGEMPDDDETKWRAEFTALGETQLRDSMNRGSLPFSERKRQFAFCWLREQDESRRLREAKIYRYTQRTFWAAVAAVIVGILGVLITLLH